MSYQNFGNGETVNLSNGGLVVTHPVSISLKQNMGVLQAVRAYNSKGEKRLLESDPHISHPAGELYGPLGVGWRISYGRVYIESGFFDGTDSWASYIYEDESGAQHHLFRENMREGIDEPYNRPKGQM